MPTTRTAIASPVFAAALLSTASAQAAIVETFTTGTGSGSADLTVNSNLSVEDGANEVRVRWGLGGGTSGPDADRVGYLRFDTSSITGQTASSASLSLSVAAAGQGGATNVVNVWGIVDGLTEDAAPGAGGWDPATINFANAPGSPTDNDNAGPTSFSSPAVVVNLGTFDVTDADVGGTIFYNDSSLLSFINGDTNGLVSLVLTRTNQDRGSTEFLSAEQAASGLAGIAPTLTVVVPEPATAGLLAAGLGVMGVRRRRSA